MSLVQVLNMYLTLNLLIAIGFLSLSLFSRLLSQLGVQLQSKFELKLHYTVISIIFGLVVLQPFLPQAKIFEPFARVWSASSLTQMSESFTAPKTSGYLSLPTPLGLQGMDTTLVSSIWSWLALLILGFGLARLYGDLRKLLKIAKSSFLIRSIGRVRIFAHEHTAVPFSYWLPGQANVVLPVNIVSSPSNYQIALAHELQHHRQRDTKWVYALWGLKLICVPNPLIHLWNRWISEIQEFACDETLVDQNKVDSQAYARCLIEVAQTAVNLKHVPVCATGLTFLVDRNILKRRIEKMLSQEIKPMGRSISYIVGVSLLCIMGFTAYASKGLVQDRRVTLAQAQAMAKKDAGSSAFPVVVNDLVLRQLNRYIGTPEGREFMRNALQRMETYRTLVEDKLKAYDAPKELMAIPIIESGYQNLEAKNAFGWGAGLWMFIAPTARTYGLRVDSQVDERLNANLLTDAAMRYLQSNHLRFKDWHLAALAYNIGEERMQKAIARTGSRDAWFLIRNGVENDRDYLPKLMAAILIMRNPESVE